ncbi:hypothetical protein [Streptomyces sp. NPDC051286]|uniref:hypothetical protein n=1 Tax=Streptomyces sp. NPDC051286 TaxID=3365647 RepID=UPI00379A8C86
MALLLSLLYMGGILSPDRNLHELPIGLVDLDQGPPLPGQQTLGAQVGQVVVDSPPADTVEWRLLDQARLHEELASGKIYGALVMPAGFTAPVAALKNHDAC